MAGLRKIKASGDPSAGWGLSHPKGAKKKAIYGWKLTTGSKFGVHYVPGPKKEAGLTDTWSGLNVIKKEENL